MTLEQEHELLLGIQSDKKEFGRLFDLYYKPIFGYLFRRTADYDLAKDMAAETFLKAYLKVPTFVWQGISLSAWLYKIATNEANQFYRKRKYRPVTLESILDHELIKLPDSEEERTAIENELKAHADFLDILEKLKSLDIKYQETISLRYFENKNIREISDILNKPEGTIKSILSRGLEKLRQLVTDEK